MSQLSTTVSVMIALGSLNGCSKLACDPVARAMDEIELRDRIGAAKDAVIGIDDAFEDVRIVAMRTPNAAHPAAAVVVNPETCEVVEFRWEEYL